MARAGCPARPDSWRTPLDSTPHRPPSPRLLDGRATAARSLWWLVALLCALTGCSEPDPDASGRTAPMLRLDERPALPVRDAQTVTTPSLASREALDTSNNLLVEDPRPLHPPRAVPGGRLRRARAHALPTRFSWVTENYMQVHEIHDYVGERVARRHQTDPSQWAPQLAERVTRSDDGRVYTIELRRGVRWQKPFRSPEVHDWLHADDIDRELTAADFAFTFEMLKDTRVVSAAPLRSWYRDCERLEVVDDHTFRMVWRQGGLAAEMWTMWFAPIPRFIFAYDEHGALLREPATELETHFYRFPIGTGPYQLAAESPAELIRLERNPEYAGVAPPIDEIEFNAMSPDRLASALSEGSIDVARLTPPLYLQLVARAGPDSPYARGRFEVAVVPSLSYDYIAWNLREPLVADVRVRRALTMALNRERALEEVWYGLGLVRSGPYSPMTPYADPQIEPLPFDLRRAGALLDEAGWRDDDGDGVRERPGRFGSPERLVLRLMAGGTESAEVFGMFTADLASIGVEVQPVLPEEDLSAGAAHGRYGSWGHDWEDDPFQVFHSSQAVLGGSNAGAYASDRADALIEAIRTEPDHDARVALHRQLHAVLHEEQPYTFMTEHHTVLAWGRRVRGVEFGRTPPHDLTLSWWLDREVER